MCCVLVRESRFPLLDPKFPRSFAVLALKLVGHPDQRGEDDRAITAGQVNDARLDDEAAEFDLMPFACCLVALERGQMSEQIAATSLERTPHRVWSMPASSMTSTSRLVSMSRVVNRSSPSSSYPRSTRLGELRIAPMISLYCSILSTSRVRDAGSRECVISRLCSSQVRLPLVKTNGRRDAGTRRSSYPRNPAI